MILCQEIPRSQGREQEICLKYQHLNQHVNHTRDSGDIQQKIPKSRVDVLEPEKRVLTAPLDEACFQDPQESPCTQ
jgi:hypothetical protein